MDKYTYVEHTFEPVYDKNSKILILGSFPSVKSRENQFFYGHPQNRFWKVIAQVTGEEVPTIKSMDDSGNVVYIGSFSKVFSPGLR